jgi:heme A synthase
MDTVQYLSVNLLLELPVLLVALIGCVLALAYWRRHPKISALTLCASLLYFLQSLVGLGFYGLLPPLLVKQDWKPDSIVLTMRVMHLFQSLAIVISLALFLAAIFKGRKASLEGTTKL